jgi:hypothetical protein
MSTISLSNVDVAGLSVHLSVHFVFPYGHLGKCPLGIICVYGHMEEAFKRWKSSF